MVETGYLNPETRGMAKTAHPTNTEKTPDFHKNLKKMLGINSHP